MASQFPKLPGYVPTQDVDRTNFKRQSELQQNKNKEIKNIEQTLYTLPRSQPVKQPDQSKALNPEYLSSSHSVHTHVNEQVEHFQPDWVKMDRHVLRFYGFYKESAVESNYESYRIRKLIILYYLEDNSIQISEPKQENSGIPQGHFLKRQRIIRNDGRGEFLNVNDFFVNQDVDIFSKRIRIYDCDQYTREFYANIGVQQEQSVQPKQDVFEHNLNNKYVPKKDKQLMDYLEHKLGGGKVKSEKQFLENDRKVLKFFVESDIPYIMHYYLADDTIDVREVKIQNNGRDNFPKLLKRQKLPKKFSLNQPGQTYQEDFVTPEDIQFNQTVSVYGKIFLVKGCDEYTHQYYAENYNLDFPIGNGAVPEEPRKNNIIIPPYNGIGDEEDSLGQLYRLIPKPPKKDYFKWVDNQVLLRFRARFNTNKPEDVNRKFIFVFYLNDDTLMIYEPAIRNSGIMEGKFLERSKYKNVNNNNEYFSPADFQSGQNLTINGYSFCLLDSDEFTQKWYQENFQ